ncbi:MAG: efflux RND transporter permease subunit [Spirochaetes bacterium]|nr:efflux RND transporter permease subunit [Spirochaetota bacterium]
MILESWYGRPVMAACILAGAAALGAVALSGAEFGPSESASRAAFAVTIRHDGVDAKAMERSITEPLEDALSSVPGRGELRSTTEYGKSRVVVFMRDAEGLPDQAYAAVRDASERVYASMPDSVQRPEIASTSEGGRSVWIAAVGRGGPPDPALGELVEREMKTSFAKLRGAGEVETSGAGTEEVHILVDPIRAAGFAIGLGELGAFVAANDAAIPVGYADEGGILLPVGFAGRVASLSSFTDLLVPSKAGPIPIRAFARVVTANRTPDAISRVDGEPAPVIAVMPGGKANIMKLSKAIAAEASSWKARGYSFVEIADVGAELAEAFGGILSATLQGMVFVAACMPFLAGGLRNAVAAVACVPITAFAAAVFLAALRVPFDDSVLSGLAAGLGASVDAVVVAVERIGSSRSAIAAAGRMRSLLPSLIGGAATMVVVLFPLSSPAFGQGELRSTSLAVGAVAVAAILAAIFIAPLIALAGRTESPLPGAPRKRAKGNARNLARTASRMLVRTLTRIVVGSVEHPLLPLASCAACVIVSVAFAALTPLDFESGSADGTVSVHVECERGAAAESVDDRLAAYAASLRAIPGVRMVQTGARPGSGDAEIAFDPELTTRDRIASAARTAGSKIPDSFVFLTDGGNSRERSYELCVSGDDDAVLKSIASEVAGRLTGDPVVSEVILNFKEGPDTIVYEPEPARASPAAVADALRRQLYGPVIHKSISGGREIDVRIQAEGAERATSGMLAAYPVPVREGAYAPAGSVGDFFRLSEPQRIYRKDRRRAAFLTMRTNAPDVAAAKRAGEAAFRATPMPPGYGWEFDREAVELERRSTAALWGFAVAVAFVYLILAALSESFGAPALALLVLPPAILPALAALAIGNGSLRVSGIGALVLLAGIAVNSSIIVVDEARARGLGTRKPGPLGVYRAVRSRAGALAATTLTAVAGAVPLVFAPGAGASFLRSIAAATAFGTVGAYTGAVFVLPAAISAFPGLLCLHRAPGAVPVREAIA